MRNLCISSNSEFWKVNVWKSISIVQNQSRFIIVLLYSIVQLYSIYNLNQILFFILKLKLSRKYIFFYFWRHSIYINVRSIYWWRPCDEDYPLTFLHYSKYAIFEVKLSKEIIKYDQILIDSTIYNSARKIDYKYLDEDIPLPHFYINHMQNSKAKFSVIS